MDKRKITQVIAAIATNSNIKGFFEGKIFKGNSKKICVPGLNCYSCPGAVGACPIGSLQAVIGSAKFKFSFYIVGFLAMLGLFLGRFICGWLCLFGLIQELLYKVPIKKIAVPEKTDHVLRYIKYIVLALFVIILPMVLCNEFGGSPPYFCQFICPAGMLEGGIPLVLMNKGLRSAAGFLFAWKFFILVLVIIASMMIYRPFCKYICPLGAFYGLFNKVSFVRLHLDENKCINCKKCSKACNMQVEVYKNPNSAECIRCGECAKVCQTNALHLGIGSKNEDVVMKCSARNKSK